MHPIDITLSHWQCTLDDKNTVRLGLSYVQGLKQAAAQRLLHERQQQSFISLVDFERRVQLGNADLQNLAEVGAFAPFGKTRRQALWQVANLKERSAGVLGTIHTEDTSAPLPEMSLTERVIADFKTTQVSAGPHPMAFMRQHLHANATLSAHALKALPHGKIARTAGLVRVRQRPMTAKGFFFITLEDETGHANIILTPKMFENYRSIAVGAVAMWAEGVVQNQDNVVHLKCTRIEALEARFPKNTTTELSTWGSRYG